MAEVDLNPKSHTIVTQTARLMETKQQSADGIESQTLGTGAVMF